MRAAGLLLIFAGCTFQVPGVGVPAAGDPSGGANNAPAPIPPLSSVDLAKPADLSRTVDLASAHCSNMCCDDSCAAGENCQLGCQEKGCSCDFTCHGGSNCGVSCRDQARCNVSVEKGERVDITCQDKASCDVQCAPGAVCNVTCPGDARCSCTGDGCSFVGCLPMKCKGGLAVCGENCPP